MIILWKITHIMLALRRAHTRLMLFTCLCTLTNGLENAALTEISQHKISRMEQLLCHIVHCSWQENVHPSQYFVRLLLSLLIEQNVHR